MSVSDYSTTPGANTSISGVNIAEGCSPAGINDAVRQMMADTKMVYDARVTTGDLSAYMETALNLSDLADAATARTNLGLGDISVKATTDFVAQAGSVQVGGMGATLSPAVPLRDWNLVEHAISGEMPYIMRGVWTNGPGPDAYYHVSCREYQKRDGTGRIFQAAYPYIDYGTDKEKNAVWFRNRDAGLAGVWGAWRKQLTDLDPIDPWRDLTHQDMIGSRAQNVVYQNTTGGSISVQIRPSGLGGYSLTVSPDNVTWVTVGKSGAIELYMLSAIIPNGHYYKYSGPINLWVELR